MKELFFKALKWAFFVGCFVAGLGFLWFTSKGEIQWTFASLMCFGMVFWLSGFWRDMPVKTTALTIFITGCLAALGYYLPLIAYILADQIVPFGFFIRWIMVVFIPGIPIMMFVFKVMD